MNTAEGVWLSITDYSRYKSLSISTVRRHLKNKILKYKEENGKYYIYTPSVEKVRLREDEEVLRGKLEIERMKLEIRQLHEENSELRMLVEIYEKKSFKIDTARENLPDLPEII